MKTRNQNTIKKHFEMLKKVDIIRKSEISEETRILEKRKLEGKRYLTVPMQRNNERKKANCKIGHRNGGGISERR